MRKLIGFVLLIVNTILSLLSFLAVYGVVNFLSNDNNYKFSAGTIQSNILNVTSTTPKYLYVGTFTFNNTSLFNFDNITVSFGFTFTNSTNHAKYVGMNYTGNFGSVPAGQMRVFSLNFTTSASSPNSTLTINPAILNGTFNPIGLNITNLYLEFYGAYVFDLFIFDLKMTQLGSLMSLFV
jgi:hypothetical protein